MTHARRTCARVLIDVGDASAFPSAAHLASYTGLAPSTRCSSSSRGPAAPGGRHHRPLPAARRRRTRSVPDCPPASDLPHATGARPVPERSGRGMSDLVPTITACLMPSPSCGLMTPAVLCAGPDVWASGRRSPTAECTPPCRPGREPGSATRCTRCT
ncbi:transposase [Kitasatospora sp. NPDC057541]|uniref:transposase n=1 Tax=unclassified Kitasatospora TaxID=2633591 RepID=UPI0036D03FE3